MTERKNVDLWEKGGKDEPHFSIREILQGGREMGLRTPANSGQLCFLEESRMTVSL